MPADACSRRCSTSTGYLAELRRQPRPAGRDPDREPRRAGRGRRASSSATNRRGHARRLPRAGLAGGRRRRDPDEAVADGARAGASRPGRRHADDPAHRQGPGVPGRCSSPGSRTASSRTCARSATRRSSRRSAGSRTSGITRARQRLYLSRAAVRSSLGRSRRTARPAGSSTRCRRELVDWRREVDGRPARPRPDAGGRAARAAARRPVAGQPRGRAPRARRPGHPRHLRARHRHRGRGRRRPRRGARRLPRPTAASGCCCATPRSRSSEPGGPWSAVGRVRPPPAGSRRPAPTPPAPARYRHPAGAAAA